MTGVLIADDEPISRRVLQASLVRWGYDVEVAKDGEEALEALLRDTAPRLAVLDWMMPRLDGLEVCRRARARPGAPYSYLLLLTSREGRSDLVAGLDAGVDHFKRVNDRHGHQAGDEVLRELAARLSAVLRTYDALGRYGGEELIAVLPECGTAASLAVAERMRCAAASVPIGTQAGGVTVMVSIGSASCPAGQTDAVALIARADAALYRAKNGGRNRVEAAPSRTM